MAFFFSVERENQHMKSFKITVPRLRIVSSKDLNDFYQPLENPAKPRAKPPAWVARGLLRVSDEQHAR